MYSKPLETHIKLQTFGIIQQLPYMLLDGVDRILQNLDYITRFGLQFFLLVVVNAHVHDGFSCSFQHSTAPSSDKFIHSLSLVRGFCQDSVFVTYPKKGAHTDENDYPADICQPISSGTSAPSTT